MDIKHIEGLVAAPFTPMHGDGSLNLDLIPGYYQFLKRNNIKGAFISGSTGEGVSMTADEKRQLMKAWVEAAKGDRDFIIMPLLGGTCISECKALAADAQRMGVGAISFTSPFYFKPPNVKVLADICAEIAAAAPELPFYYYHIPVLTGVGFAMKGLLKEVHGRIKNFAGIKYTHEDFMDFLSCLHFENGRYDMLWGRDENLLPALSIGAKGGVGSTFNYAAPLYYGIIEAYAKRDEQRARKLQQQSIDMIELLGKYGGIATGKAYMKKVGMDCGKFRLPVLNMTDEKFAEFSAEVDGLGFKDYCSK